MRALIRNDRSHSSGANTPIRAMTPSTLGRGGELPHQVSVPNLRADVIARIDGIGGFVADAAWLTVGGAVIGYAIKAGQDWWLAAGKLKADREARAETRRDRRAERRDDLQRQTLLALQDAAIAVCRSSCQLHDIDMQAHRAGQPWGPASASTDLAEADRQTNAQMRLLRSRVIDEKVRVLAERLHDTCSALTLAGCMNDAIVARITLLRILEELQDRSGHLIRRMDDQG